MLMVFKWPNFQTTPRGTQTQQEVKERCLCADSSLEVIQTMASESFSFDTSNTPRRDIEKWVSSNVSEEPPTNHNYLFLFIERQADSMLQDEVPQVRGGFFVNDAALDKNGSPISSRNQLASSTIALDSRDKERIREKICSGMIYGAANISITGRCIKYVVDCTNCSFGQCTISRMLCCNNNSANNCSILGIERSKNIRLVSCTAASIKDTLLVSCEQNVLDHVWGSSIHLNSRGLVISNASGMNVLYGGATCETQCISRFDEFMVRNKVSRRLLDGCFTVVEHE